MKLGELYPEIGFLTQAALDRGGVEIENTGHWPARVNLRLSAARAFSYTRSCRYELVV
jgi:hypothetical protein